MDSKKAAALPLAWNPIPVMYKHYQDQYSITDPTLLFVESAGLSRESLYQSVDLLANCGN